MSWLDQIGGMLRRYLGGTPEQSQAVYDDYGQCVNCAPQPALAGGMADAFRSDQTPPFGQIVSQLFGQSDAGQRAGLLNTLLNALGPDVASQALSASGLSWLSGLWDGQGHVTPQQASQIPPEAVAQLAYQAENQNPSIIDAVSNFYAQHPDLVRTLGAGVLGAILSGVAGRHVQGSGEQVLPASQDPYGDPADQYGQEQVLPASRDPYGDPADEEALGQPVLPSSQDPWGDPADQEARR